MPRPVSLSYMNTTVSCLPKDHPFRAALPPTASEDDGIIDCGKARRTANRRAYVLDGCAAWAADELDSSASSILSLSSTRSNSSLKLIQKLGNEYAATLYPEPVSSRASAQGNLTILKGLRSSRKRRKL